MKKLKALLASMTALSCLCASYFPVMEQIKPICSIFASAEATSGICGENLTWNFDKSTGTLTISGTGAMNNAEFIDSFKYSVIGIDWYYFREDIKKIRCR